MFSVIFDMDGVIWNTKVLSQSETPGLGANMTIPDNVLESSILKKNPAELTFKVKKDDANGSFDSLTGSTISSRAYVNAVETAYAGYLKAKGMLDESKISGVSGATKKSDAKSDTTVIEDGDTMSVTTDMEECQTENLEIVEEK